MCYLLLAPRSMPHKEPWRISTQAYSPNCLEGVFSEVEHSPGPTPMGVSDVDLPASRYYPDFLIIPNGRTLPHDGLGRLDRDRAEFRLYGVLRSSPTIHREFIAFNLNSS